jgi:cyclophilin family peptidyl-prolyl cis-trans isomerase
MPNTKYQVPFALVVGLLLILIVRLGHSGTLATFETRLGNMELEFYDEDKPVTVSNFVKYVTSGRFTNEFIQRWVPGFVIQGGGYAVTNTPNGLDLTPIEPFGTITNEYSVGRKFSNTYGTIAMARSSGKDSATSQWFLNLKDNSFLDDVNGGFTVFGRVTAGANILNLFIPPSPTNLYSFNLGLTPQGEGTPVLGKATNNAQLFAGLIYVDIKLRRDLGLTVTRTFRGEKKISWNAVAGVTNTLEYSTSGLPGSWNVYTNIVGSGAVSALFDNSGDASRIYRVSLKY